MVPPTPQDKRAVSNGRPSARGAIAQRAGRPSFSISPAGADTIPLGFLENHGGPVQDTRSEWRGGTMHLAEWTCFAKPESSRRERGASPNAKTGTISKVVVAASRAFVQEPGA